jgi:hypothetical protein
MLLETGLDFASTLAQGRHRRTDNWRIVYFTEPVATGINLASEQDEDRDLSRKRCLRRMASAERTLTPTTV